MAFKIGVKPPGTQQPAQGSTQADLFGVPKAAPPPVPKPTLRPPLQKPAPPLAKPAAASARPAPAPPRPGLSVKTAASSSEAKGGTWHGRRQEPPPRTASYFEIEEWACDGLMPTSDDEALALDYAMGLVGDGFDYRSGYRR